MKRRQVEHGDDDGRYKQAGSAVVASEPAMPLARGRRHAAFQRKQSALNEQFAAWVEGQVGIHHRAPRRPRSDGLRSIAGPPLSDCVDTPPSAASATSPPTLNTSSHTLTHRPYVGPGKG